MIQWAESFIRRGECNEAMFVTSRSSSQNFLTLSSCSRASQLLLTLSLVLCCILRIYESYKQPLSLSFVPLLSYDPSIPHPHTFLSTHVRTQHAERRSTRLRLFTVVSKLGYTHARRFTHDEHTTNIRTYDEHTTNTRRTYDEHTTNIRRTRSRSAPFSSSPFEHSLPCLR